MAQAGIFMMNFKLKSSSNILSKKIKDNYHTEMILIFQTNRSGQTVQTQIRLFQLEQSDQGLHCLQFNFHLFDEIPYGFAFLFEF